MILNYIYLAIWDAQVGPADDALKEHVVWWNLVEEEEVVVHGKKSIRGERRGCSHTSLITLQVQLLFQLQSSLCRFYISVQYYS